MKFQQLARLYGMKKIPTSMRAGVHSRQSLDLFHHRVKERRLQWQSQVDSDSSGSEPPPHVAQELANQLHQFFQSQHLAQLMVPMTREMMTQLSLTWLTLQDSQTLTRQ